MITILSPNSHYDFLSLMPKRHTTSAAFSYQGRCKEPRTVQTQILEHTWLWPSLRCYRVVGAVVCLMSQGGVSKNICFFLFNFGKKPAMTWLVQENKTWRWDFTRSSWSFRVRFAATHGIHPSFNSKFLITTNWLPWVHPKTSTVCSSSPS